MTIRSSVVAALCATVESFGHEKMMLSQIPGMVHLHLLKDRIFLYVVSFLTVLSIPHPLWPLSLSHTHTQRLGKGSSGSSCEQLVRVVAFLLKECTIRVLPFKLSRIP